MKTYGKQIGSQRSAATFDGQMEMGETQLCSFYSFVFFLYHTILCNITFLLKQNLVLKSLSQWFSPQTPEICVHCHRTISFFQPWVLCELISIMSRNIARAALASLWFIWQLFLVLGSLPALAIWPYVPFISLVIMLISEKKNAVAAGRALLKPVLELEYNRMPKCPDGTIGQYPPMAP